MNIGNQYSVIPAPGLPVIPTPEPESKDGGPFLDSGTPDRRFRLNDDSLGGLF